MLYENGRPADVLDGHLRAVPAMLALQVVKQSIGYMAGFTARVDKVDITLRTLPCADVVDVELFDYIPRAGDGFAFSSMPFGNLDHIEAPCIADACQLVAKARDTPESSHAGAIVRSERALEPLFCRGDNILWYRIGATKPVEKSDLFYSLIHDHTFSVCSRRLSQNSLFCLLHCASLISE